MKKYHLLFILSLFCPFLGHTQWVSNCTDCDTVWGTRGADRYLIGTWYDTTQYFLEGCGEGWNGCFRTGFEPLGYNPGDIFTPVYNRNGGTVKIKGLMAMTRYEILPNSYDSPTPLPEYLYVYRKGPGFGWPTCNNRVDSNSSHIYGSQMFTVVDSVRWDTVKPYVWMQLESAVDTVYHPMYVFEAYFDKPLVMTDSIFWLKGSNNNFDSINPLTHQWAGPWKTYMTLQSFFWPLYNSNGELPDSCQARFLDMWRKSFVGGYNSGIITLPSSYGYGPFPTPYEPWYYDLAHRYPTVFDTCRYKLYGADLWMMPLGFFMPIVDFYNLTALGDSLRGSTTGSCRTYDGARTPIKAIPYEGYRFVSWSDGNTENPRYVTVESDTTFQALFAEAALYHLDLSSNNPEWGSVEGGGDLYGDYDYEIRAIPANEHYYFQEWGDGPTCNPRTIRLHSDTSIMAYFIKLMDVTTPPTATQGVSISPNPVGDYLEVTMPSEDTYRIEIFDQLGYSIKHFSMTGNHARIDVSNLPAGNYLLKATTDTGSSTGKFVKM